MARYRMSTRRTRASMPRRVRKQRSGTVFRRKLLGNSRPIFTETIPVSPLVSNQVGNFGISINQLSQYASYAALYRQYRILRLQVILLPEQTVGESLDNGDTPPVFVTSGVGRIVYAINDMPGLPAPANEVAVLNENGCKIRTMARPLRISCKPVPDVEVSNSGQANAYLPIDLRNRYLDINYGSTVPYTGISYAYSAPTPQTVQVYYKVTFQLKEPK